MGAKVDRARFFDASTFDDSIDWGTVTRSVDPLVEIRIDGFSPVMTHDGTDLAQAVRKALSARPAGAGVAFDIGNDPLGEGELKIEYKETLDIFELQTGAAAGPGLFSPSLLEGLDQALSLLGY